MNDQLSTKAFDIKRVFKEKNARMAALLPGFIYNYLKRILHEDDVNALMSRNGSKMEMDFVKACIDDFNITLKVEGFENVPDDGRFIFIANHPLGGFDGLMLMQTIYNRYGTIRVLINDILMNLTNLNTKFIPINKHGRQIAELSKLIDDAYQSDEQLLTFPAGLVSRRIKGQIVDLPWQKSFIAKAREFNRDVVPVHISGSCSNFFYNLAAIRKFFGIKANIEMLYLIDETWQHNDKEFTITFGKPIASSTFDKSKRPAEWANYVRQEVYKLVGIENIPS